MSILEHVHIQIDPTSVADYLTAFAKACPLVIATPGCLNCELLSHEAQAGNFLLLIRWESREHHAEGFRRSEAYREWSRLLHPFYDVFPEVLYYRTEI